MCGVCANEAPGEEKHARTFGARRATALCLCSLWAAGARNSHVCCCPTADARTSGEHWQFALARSADLVLKISRGQDHAARHENTSPRDPARWRLESRQRRHKGSHDVNRMGQGRLASTTASGVQVVTRSNYGCLPTLECLGKITGDEDIDTSNFFPALFDIADAV